MFTIYLSISGDEGSQRPHSFKSSSFTIPTECGYCAVREMSVNLLWCYGLTEAFCQTSIWGLSKQGKTCKACGLSVHSKCELKVRFS